MSETAIFICPSCGGPMEFDIPKQKFCCKNCGTETRDTEGDGVVTEYNFSEMEVRKARLSKNWNAGRHSFSCTACGAEISVDGVITSAVCPYCGSSHVLEAKQNDGIPPEGIVPFQVDKNRAGEVFRRWANSRFWAPNAFKRLYQQDKFQPIYHPYWTYDANTRTSYSAQGGKVYYVTVGSGKNKRTERRVSWHSVRGTWERFFDDVLVDAGRQTALMDRVSHYDTAQTQPFAPAYLAGYSAERYIRMPGDCFGDAQRFMTEEIRGEITSHILSRYDEVRGLSTDVHFSDIKFKHVLLPIWSGGLTFRGKTYNVAINGQSGIIAGQYPKSTAKIVTAVIAGAAVLGGILYLMSQYL